MKKTNTTRWLPALPIVVILTACTNNKATDVSMTGGTTLETLSSLQNGPRLLIKTDTKTGTGAEAKTGQSVTVHYTGWLYDESAANKRGKKFDSSLDRGNPFSFPLGANRVIKGWDQGVPGMKVGGQRTLIIPANMAYGSRGAGSAIPPNAPLIFDVELLGVQAQ
ncbi:MAG: FKBP-type peptidyl-prolyl cis-trans isomerase [Thiolinea sp.]